MKSFIITGVQMRNKGSQAMLFSVIHGLKQYYPDCEVICFSLYIRDLLDKEAYRFSILPWNVYTRFLFLTGIQRVPFMRKLITKYTPFRKIQKEIPLLHDTLKRADVIIDASGYNLGSGWPLRTAIGLLATIMVAKKYKKRIILMPQSFGPFEWYPMADWWMKKAIKRVLRYPAHIYCREKEGEKLLLNMRLKNVSLSSDIVIREKAFAHNDEVFCNINKSGSQNICENAIGFVINQNLISRAEKGCAIAIYRALICNLLDRGERLVILTSSGVDTVYIDRMLDGIEKTDKLIVLKDEYNSIQLIDIIGHLKFLIASRYHSVIFAYRSAVPVVILGWAVKYDNLAALFKQEQYVVGLNELNAEYIQTVVNDMLDSYFENSEIIKAQLPVVQGKSLMEEVVSFIADK